MQTRLVLKGSRGRERIFETRRGPIHGVSTAASLPQTVSKTLTRPLSPDAGGKYLYMNPDYALPGKKCDNRRF